MMTKHWLIAALLISALSAGLANAQGLPGTSRDFKFDKKMSKLDLENFDKYDFHFKTGGTSIGFKISKKGKRKSGVFAPYNSSSVPEGEVVTYRLARLLRISHIFNPVDYYTLGPNATKRFRRMLRRERNRWRKKNTRNISRKIRRNSRELFGIYKYRHKRRSQGVERLSKRNRFNTKHFLARYIKASSSRPSSDKVRLRRITRDKKKHKHPRESERELARQLSTIFVMDMLTGQWDRFSGGNIEAYAHKNGRLQFIARDNGGATFSSGWKWYRRYTRWVSRFDRPFIMRLIALNDFLRGRTNEYEGFRDAKSMRKTLGFLHGSSFRHFKTKLRHFAEKRIKTLRKRYGEAIFFKDPPSQ